MTRFSRARCIRLNKQQNGDILNRSPTDWKWKKRHIKPYLQLLPRQMKPWTAEIFRQKKPSWSVNRTSQCTRPRSPSEPQSPGMPNGNEAACGARHASTWGEKFGMFLKQQQQQQETNKQTKVKGGLRRMRTLIFNNYERHAGCCNRC